MAAAMPMLVGSGCSPASHSLLASNTAHDAAPHSAATPADRRLAQASTPTGRYISDTVTRLVSACASVV